MKHRVNREVEKRRDARKSGGEGGGSENECAKGRTDGKKEEDGSRIKEERVSAAQ